MIAAAFLMVAKEDWDHDEFVEYWENEHAPIANDLPGLKKYTTLAPDNHDETPYDGLAVLYFDSVEDFETAMDSEVGEAVLEDVEHFCLPDEGEMLLGEETVQVDRT